MFRQFVGKNRYAVFFMALLFCFFQFSIRKLYGFSIYPDEFSYWAYAAAASGYDWSEVISLGSFYSYGYSILLFPVFLLCKNPVTAYRTAVALNFILLGLSYLLLVRIQQTAGSFFAESAERTDRAEQVKNEKAQIYAGFAILYPPILFYAQTTMAETLLMAGYLLLVLLTVDHMRRPGRGKLLSIFLLNFFLYLVHMRTVGTLAVCAAILFFMAVKRRRDYKEAFLILLLTALTLLGAEVLEQKMLVFLYRDLNRELYEINTYEGQLAKIKYIFSRTGCIAFAAGFAGKILYLGISTYGLGWWGMLHLIKTVRQPGKRTGLADDTAAVRGLTAIFIVMSAVAQIGVSTVYHVIPDSYDGLTFGRYQDYIMPLLIVAGMEGMLTHIRQKKRYVLAAALTMALISAFVAAYAARLELTQSKGYFMAGMSFFERKEFEPTVFYAGACMIGILCMCSVVAAAFVYDRIRQQYILLVCVLLPLVLTIRLGRLYLYPFNELARQDIRLTERMERLSADEAYEPRLTYLDYNEISAIGLVQFALRDLPVRVLSEDGESVEDLQGELDDRSILLLGADDPRQEALERMYDKEVISGHFVLLYNDRK